MNLVFAIALSIFAMATSAMAIMEWIFQRDREEIEDRLARAAASLQKAERSLEEQRERRQRVQRSADTFNSLRDDASRVDLECTLREVAVHSPHGRSLMGEDLSARPNHQLLNDASTVIQELMAKSPADTLKMGFEHIQDWARGEKRSAGRKSFNALIVVQLLAVASAILSQISELWT